MYVYFDILYIYEEFISSIVEYFFITFLSHGRDVTERHKGPMCLVLLCF